MEQTVNVSIFLIIILLFIVHTGLQHLLNWGVRVAHKRDDPGLVFLYTIAFIVEVILCVVAIGFLTGTL